MDVMMWFKTHIIGHCAKQEGSKLYWMSFLLCVMVQEVLRG